MAKKKQTILERVIESIEFSIKYPRNYRESGIAKLYLSILRVLLIKQPDAFDFVYDEFKRDPNPWAWFAGFHKSIRQCDLFSGYNIQKSLNDLTPEEEKRHRELYKKFHETNGEPWDDGQELIEFKSLNKRKQNKEDVSLDGHLDVMLYNMIYIDEGFLEKMFSFTFEDIEEFDQKEPTKDYEILTFKRNKDGVLYNLTPYKTYTLDNKSFSLKEELLKYEHSISIYSVKRISDGEVFTIGDEIMYAHDSKPIGKIDKMWVSFEQLRCDIGNLGQVLCHDIDKRNDIVKVK